ncbi:unnamed protein product, partial [marine sediment metagenome]
TDLYSEFLKNKKINHESINYKFYSRKNQAKRLAQIIKNSLAINSNLNNNNKI